MLQCAVGDWVVFSHTCALSRAQDASPDDTLPREDTPAVPPGGLQRGDLKRVMRYAGMAARAMAQVDLGRIQAGAMAAAKHLDAAQEKEGAAAGGARPVLTLLDAKPGVVE